MARRYHLQKATERSFDVQQHSQNPGIGTDAISSLIILILQLCLIIPHRIVVNLQILHHLRKADLWRSFIVVAATTAALDLTSQLLFIHENIDALLCGKDMEMTSESGAFQARI